MEEVNSAMVSIEGNPTFQLSVRDNCTPGSGQGLCLISDQIAITFYKKSGGIWFSGYWDATQAKSIKQAIWGRGRY